MSARHVDPRTSPEATAAEQLAATRMPRRGRVDRITELIGNTPLVRLAHIEAEDCPGVELWAKCEFTNPAGSVKDHPALRMI